MRLMPTITLFALGAAIHFGPSIPFAEIGSIGSLDDAVALVQGAPNDADVALEARCGAMQESKRRTCEEALTARFAAGGASPESLIRLHCTRVESVWDARLPEPPALCAERYGGWVTG
jgi:hypothetical protein